MIPIKDKYKESSVYIKIIWKKETKQVKRKYCEN